MELGVVLYDQSEIVITSQGNKISRKAKTYGTQNIRLSGYVGYFFLFFFISL